MVRDKLSIDKDSEVSIRLISRREKDGRTYNRPMVSEIAALIEGDIGPNMEKRDIIAFHQFLVDGYMMVESHRLNYIRFNQDRLRVDNYKNLSNAVGRGDIEPFSARARYIIPATFPGSDKWKQRGLPHAHTLLFLHREYKFHEPRDVDKIISAEIPNPIKEPILYTAVCEYMLHGPCGKEKLSSPCMVGENCSKHYPKPCTERTTVDGEGYPIYKRSKKGVTVKKDGSSYIRRNEEDPGRFDEIKRFYDCRYLSACEAAWRLQYHLPNEQHVVFDDNDFIDDIIDKSSKGVSRFLNWIGCNSSEQRDMQGPKCFEDIRIVDQVVCATFREACYKLGLLGDDKEYIDAIKQAAYWGSGFYLRNLFLTLLQSGTLSMPTTVWEETWQLLSDDIHYRQRKLLKNPALQLTDEELKNYALMDIENSLQLNGSSLIYFKACLFQILQQRHTIEKR
ncbi:uncharacterized protein LOC141608043 [Silene latifolia]|uniref:uncharacterized protein LOC141608043 n=1 Tax=Silene latifolia TaxID=37657 RepID=UPI003D780A24